MKTFKQYISEEVLTESISAIADDIKDTLVNSANTMSFDPADMEKHRLLGTYNDLLKGKGPRSNIRGSQKTIDDPLTFENQTEYVFDFGEPDTTVRINIDQRKNMEKPHDVRFTFGTKYSKNDFIDPTKRAMLMPHVYEGVMRSLAHYAIHNKVHPEQFDFYAFGDSELKVLPSGTVRKTSDQGQKRRIYDHIGTALKAIMPNSSK